MLSKTQSVCMEQKPTNSHYFWLGQNQAYGQTRSIACPATEGRCRPKLSWYSTAFKGLSYSKVIFDNRGHPHQKDLRIARHVTQHCTRQMHQRNVEFSLDSGPNALRFGLPKLGWKQFQNSSVQPSIFEAVLWRQFWWICSDEEKCQAMACSRGSPRY